MKTVKDELAALFQKHGDKLQAEQVVEFARNPKTALHTRFDWDDSEAAEKWRLHQARNLIRVEVVMLKGSDEPVRAFVSLRDDRTAGIGYRTIASVMSDSDRRAKLLAEAEADFRALQMKWKQLRELAPIFDAMDSVFPKGGTRKPKRKAVAV